MARGVYISNGVFRHASHIIWKKTTSGRIKQPERSAYQASRKGYLTPHPPFLARKFGCGRPNQTYENTNVDVELANSQLRLSSA